VGGPRKDAGEAREAAEKVIVRDAKPSELNFLQGKLRAFERDNFEQFDLRQAVVFVAEDFDGLPAGMVCLRLRCSPVSLAPMWHLEPLVLFSNFVRTSPLHSQRKATYLLATAAEAYIADSTRNTTGVRAFFVYIEDKNERMHGLAQSIGWMPIPGKLYAKET
jgi:hypothetical protein